MLLKSADDKRPGLTVLKALLDRPGTSGRQRAAIRQQINAIETGERGESDVAYFLNFSLRNNPNTHVIHDLRIEHEGRVAQIDHVVVSRYRFVYALETKSLKASLQCNAQGEWTAWYGPRGKGRPVPIASPVEQAKRHAAVLADWFKANGITGLEGVTGVVVVSPTTFVSRKSGRADAEVPVVRADLFKHWWENLRDTGSWLRAPFLLLTRMSRAELDAVCADLVASHRPHAWDWERQFDLTRTPETRFAPAAAAPPQQRSSTGDEVSTPHGVVTLKRVTDGRFALRHPADPKLAEHVERCARPYGSWQARFGNWLVPAERLDEIVGALRFGS